LTKDEENGKVWCLPFLFLGSEKSNKGCFSLDPVVVRVSVPLAHRKMGA